MKKIKMVILSVLLMCVGVYANSPVSKQVTLIDATSSSEVLVEATGIYKSDKRSKRRKKKDIKRNGVQRAMDDSRSAALYFLLLGGTDPILTQDSEKLAFKGIESEFFSDDNVLRFISYEDGVPKTKVLTDGETGIRVLQQIKVNKEALILDLEKRGVLIEKDDLLDQIGNPFIMVLPATTNDQNPLDKLKTDAQLAHAATVIQSLLTARQYDVVLPDQQQFLNDLVDGQLSLNDIPTDTAYQMALSVGSDIYIDFDVSEADAGYGTKKMAIRVRAFETTTARLLGSETGYSEARSGDDMVSIEEAMLSALDNVLARVTTYWKKDIYKGLQYKVIVSIDSGFSPANLETVQDSIIDSIDAASVKTKEQIVTDQTLDYVVWVDPNDYATSRQVWRKIRREFRDMARVGTVSLVNQNRKLLVLRIQP
ncbi:MAG: hypothetical protein CMJ93_05220 [Planctomycetes bacterium]|nr:hypothetical protein [Planctomycetota bacterium]